jgi:hypothetical protein
MRLTIVGWACLAAFVASGCVIITNGQSSGPRPYPRHVGRRSPQPGPAPLPAPPTPSTGAMAVPALATNVLPQQPPKDEPPSSPTRPSVLPAGAAEGRPPGFRPDAAPAYWIWTGPRGDWRIRTTTLDASHVFRGRIAAVTSDLKDVSASRNDLGDRMWRTPPAASEPSVWSFSFRTTQHADGFTFRVADNGCVRFDLQLDGGPTQKRIVVGKNQVEPPTNHFVVCPRGKAP